MQQSTNGMTLYHAGAIPKWTSIDTTELFGS